MNAPYSDVGIVVRVVDSGEADKYISVVSENHGLSLFQARGVRRATSKKSSHLDLFNLIRFSVGRGESPRYMNQVESVAYFPGIKSSYVKVGICMTITEILVNTLPVDSEDREIFMSLKSFLDGLEKAVNQKEINNLSRRFGLFLLRHLGYPPPRFPEKDNLSTYFEVIMNRKIISKDIK
ncbi:DNA repair protein RecO [Candidatus Collierbacteria bacterium RIFOXYB2_FULL_46_14]|uniref:DNA repair protein RecO n=1 Tax=Candidatus Collierbacteria bacterium GW2011_GWA2_46_26 TaxID=1618381 RepID=A0A0G1RUZ6_9BACT|nr:MAG: repair protein RecO protein [Candidatus Collierbacteria bacterium GW2011_GWC2_44_13]KKU33798.1 MAG: repair protein RecO protein [Candidatus Collierbacteria bacterium GW2011_GWA2_46_26]OGD73130.1 MAG: DNA repair protein RecO [Candidatus Collierbacteria bacterium RIFOXYB2_FULL_46_14]OGD76172.1 MAG: DNA repair protein RecO [Candidatus Collierbacteria bacterium RIFOXYA2_FULL_46_20]OGD77508.1 MAG: DNA repair protein RecO [Candidatus Collierbacteria bacterium RIFOXYC2_FULL_43_15]OGD80798.1 M